MSYRRGVILRMVSSSSSSTAGTNPSGNIVSPHMILGVSPTAPFSEVKNRYHELARYYHPDMPHGNPEKFRDINAAYRLLRAQCREKRSENIDSRGFWAERNYKVKNDYYERRAYEQEERDRYQQYNKNQGLMWELLWLYEGYELAIVLGAAVVVLVIAMDRYFLVQRMTREKRARIRAMEEGLPPSMPLVIDEDMIQKYNKPIPPEEIDIDNAITKEETYYRKITQRRFEDFREFLFIYDPDGVTSRKVTTRRFSIQYMDENLIPKRCTYVREFNSEKKNQRYEHIVNEVVDILKTTPWETTDAQYITPLLAKGVSLISMNSPDTAKWTFVEYKDNDKDEPPVCLMALKNNRFEKLGMCQRVTVTGSSKLTPWLVKKREADLKSGVLKKKNLVKGHKLPVKDLSIPLEHLKL